MDLSKNHALEEKWDKMLLHYEENFEIPCIEPLITSAIFAKMSKADRVLEVGCGPGKHSIFLSSLFLKKGGALVSCDISGDMVRRLGENYSESDWNRDEGNTFILDTNSDYSTFDDSLNLKANVDLSKIIEN